MLLIYKILLGFFVTYYVTFCGSLFYTSIIEDWCCNHSNFINTISSKWYKCYNFFKIRRCKYYNRLSADDLANYEIVSGRKYSENIVTEI